MHLHALICAAPTEDLAKSKSADQHLHSLSSQQSHSNLNLIVWPPQATATAKLTHTQTPPGRHFRDRVSFFGVSPPIRSITFCFGASAVDVWRKDTPFTAALLFSIYFFDQLSSLSPPGATCTLSVAESYSCMRTGLVAACSLNSLFALLLRISAAAWTSDLVERWC